MFDFSEEVGDLLLERVLIEGGFLDGLVLQLQPGLNVIVGPRGSGKTSLIELIRFAVGSTSLTSRSASAEQHAISVLGDGRVTVSARVHGQAVLFSRSGSEAKPERTYPDTAPTFFSQNEIESVAISGEGRLRLVDELRPRSATATTQHSVLAQIGSLSTELRQAASDVASLDEQIAVLAGATTALAEAEELQKKLLSESKASRDQARALEASTAEGTRRAIQLAVVRRGIAAVESLAQRLNAIGAARVLEEWPADAGPDVLRDTRPLITTAVARVSDAVFSLSQALNQMQRIETQAQSELGEHAEAERLLRRSLDELKSGLGAAARHVSDEQRRVAQLTSLQTQRKKLIESIASLQERRLIALDNLDAVRDVRFRQREAVAAELTAVLAPNVRVLVQRAGTTAAYENAIATVLRGSGLHYNTLAPMLASSLSPRELADSIEQRDSEVIADLAEISVERAERLVAHVLASGTQDILTADVEDAVFFELLDGATYKGTDAASTGQRCTVVLSILLMRHGRGLVIDQPEDHLDNAYIATTLVSALLRRQPHDQFLFTTHNANIPVLANADHVVVLNSDGRRGFVTAHGQLEEPAIVEAITSVMEGGLEAFRKRAEFYGL